MQSIGIGEIQKNTSVFTNMTEAIQIIDKRKKQVLAMVYPVKQQSVIKKLSGKYKDRVQKSDISIEEIKEFSMMEAMREKYGLSSWYEYYHPIFGWDNEDHLEKSTEYFEQIEQGSMEVLSMLKTAKECMHVEI